MALRAKDPTAVLPGTFNQKLMAAAHSLDELEALRVELVAMTDG